MKKIFLVIAIISLTTSFTKKPITWIAIGDSITYLNEHANETGNRVQKGYLTRVVEKLPNVHYINQGHNGWTSGGIAKEIENLKLVKADVYSVFLGTNDWWAGRPVGKLDEYINNSGNTTVYGSFRIIINKLRSLNPDAKIILMTPLQRGDFVYVAGFKNNAFGSYKQKNGQWLSQFADAIIAIGKQEHLPVIDLYNKSGITLKNMTNFKRLIDPATGQYKNYSYPGYIDIPFNPETDEYPYPIESINMTYDALHPSDKGNEVIAKMVAKQLKRIS
ncbi:MAG: SGNH/GDSL hydrolase family protein [Chitinophagaceae bacterium]